MDSEHIESFHYNETGNVMTLFFKGGHSCEFYPVNPETYSAIIASEALTRAIEKTIRSGIIVGINKNEGNHGN